MHTGREFMVRFWANVKSLFNTHTTNKNNPHGVTKSQIGLANVENKSSATIRGEMTSDNVTDALGYTPLDAAKKGAASGVAELDATGKVPSAQLPSYVDDTIEGYLSGGKFYKESSHTTQITGEAGKIYVELSTNKTYRWSGSTYVEISQSLALGETSTTAYRGDRGKAAYDHISNKSNPHAVTKEQVGLGNVPNVATNDQTPTFTAVDKDTALVSGEKLSSILGKIARTILTVISLKNTVDELNSNLTDVEESVAGLNGKLNMKTYDQGGITVNKINDMCFCNLNITFDNTIEPWGGTWYLGNIADPEFRAPYEKHFPCVGINQEAGISYALRISVAASGNVTIINDTKDYISPKLIYANFSYRFES